MDWKAKFITYNGDFKNAPVFKKSFKLKKNILQANVFICGLGLFEMRINGKKADQNEFLTPAFTDYDKRVLYCRYDVSKLLKSENEIEILLGRGRYSMETENVWGFQKAPWHDKQKLIFQLEIEYFDHEIEYVISDESWKVAPSATIFDCFYVGECYDSRIEGNEVYENVVLAKKPKGFLAEQNMEKICVTDTVNPVNVFKNGDITVFDFGMIYTGFVEIETEGESGRELEILYEERYSSENRKPNNNIKAVIQLDRLVLNGQKIKWKSKFSYKSFRYVEISNLPDTYKVRALQVNNDVKKIGNFDCDNDVLNWICNASNNTILRNLHGIPTDTPVYEKNGWTGDAYLISEYAMNTFDMRKFFAKWLDDIADSQQESGEIAPIVPTSGWGIENYENGWKEVEGPVPAWDVAYVILPLYFYDIYGDSTVVCKHYENLKKYTAYLESKVKDGIFSGGLGDWLPPLGKDDGNCVEPENEGSEIISTMYYCYILKLMSRVSQIAGSEAQSREYFSQFEKVKEIINRTFFDPEKKIYSSNKTCVYRQTPNILAVAFDIVPVEFKADVVRSVADDVLERENHLNCGILGTRYLSKILLENGYGDLAVDVLTAEGYPGFAFWMQQGYNTLLESWETNSRSLCHYMYGGTAIVFYDTLCGIRPEKEGYKQVNISPFIPKKLNRCAAELNTESGLIKVSWEKYEDKVKYSITIPHKVSATFGNQRTELKEGENVFVV